MSTIDSTLTSALPAGAVQMYPAEYASVLAALTERDYTLTDQITDTVAYEFGVDRDEVRRRLEMAGMAVRPKPEPAWEPEVAAEWEKELMTPQVEAPKRAKGKKSKADKLAKTVKKLVRAARSHGISL